MSTQDWNLTPSHAHSLDPNEEIAIAPHSVVAILDTQIPTNRPIWRSHYCAQGARLHGPALFWVEEAGVNHARTGTPLTPQRLARRRLREAIADRLLAVATGELVWMACGTAARLGEETGTPFPPSTLSDLAATLTPLPWVVQGLLDAATPAPRA